MTFKALYDLSAERLLVYFTRRTLDPDTALDLWAETLSQAFERWPRFRGSSEDEALAWLYAVARARWADYLRRGYAERRALGRLRIARPELDSEDIERLEELAGLVELRGRVGGGLGGPPRGPRGGPPARPR